MDPAAFLGDVLEHLARNSFPAANPAERRELLYLNAAAYLAETYPEAQQGDVHEHLAAKLPTYDADGLRVATLAVYGFACDERLRNAETWLEAAEDALRTYAAGDRVIKPLSSRSPETPVAVPA